MKKTSAFIKKSILLENPEISILVAITPLLATSSRLYDGIFMGLCAFVCIFASSIIFRVLRNIIQDKLRDIVYILISAMMVALCEIVLAAFFPSVAKSLGVYLPLLSVSGIIFSRSKKFSEVKNFGAAVVESVFCGAGYFAAFALFSLVREFLGRGSVADFAIIPEKYAISLVAGPVGGFVLLGVIIVLFRKLLGRQNGEEESK